MECCCEYCQMERDLERKPEVLGVEVNGVFSGEKESMRNKNMWDYSHAHDGKGEKWGKRQSSKRVAASRY